MAREREGGGEGGRERGERERGEKVRERGGRGVRPRRVGIAIAAQGQEPVMFNCSGCCPSYGLQICGVAPETFSLSMRSCPSSSQLIVSTNLSHVSSGNHFRSDPVQVQSTLITLSMTFCDVGQTNIGVVFVV